MNNYNLKGQISANKSRITLRGWIYNTWCLDRNKGENKEI